MMASNVRERNDDSTQGFVAEILFRLPVKSLLRLTCVSKAWHGLIGNSDFIRKNFNRRDNTTHLLISHHTRATTSYNSLTCYNLELLAPTNENFGLSRLPDDVSIIGPVNGMFFLHGWAEHGMALWNPAVRDQRPVAEPHIVVPSYFMDMEAEYGFGEDLLTNHCKLVWIRTFVDDRIECPYFAKIVAVYNTHTDSWNVFEAAFSHLFSINSSLCNTYKNGFCYWKTIPEGDGAIIIAFDLSKEEFQELPLPPDLSQVFFAHLAMFNDSIATIYFDTPEANRLNVWVMGEDSSWTKQLTVGPLDRDIHWPLGVSANGQFFLQANDSHLVVYNNNSKQFTDLGAYENGIPQVIFYKESLISVKREI